MVSGAAVLAAAAVNATSIVPPADLGELARVSDAVVLAQAGAPHVVRHGAILYTRTAFRAIETVWGPLDKSSKFSVEVLGGATADEKWVFPGSPEFEVGGVYLLMLSKKAEGVWLPRMASYGILRQATGRDGSVLLEPLAESGTVEAFPRPDGILPEPVETYVESALIPLLRDVVEGRAEWDGESVRARNQQIPIRVVALSAPAGCVFLGNGRWPSGNADPMYASNQPDTSVGDGGYGELQSALSVWAGMGSSLSPAYGGTASPNIACTSDFDTPGSDQVVFNDPCDDIPDLSSCAGTLGQGGWGAGGQHQFDGSTWWSINHWFVVVNNGAGCIGSGGYTTMLAHELGHGLGFGHTSDPNSLMYPSCCQGPDSLDVSCALYLYPSGNPPPTPTTGTPPPAPTGVSASDGTFTDRVRILWSASSGATSYHVYRNTVNNTASASDLGSVTTTGADDMGAVAGTTYWYWVKAFNASGSSSFSLSDTGYRTGTSPTPTPTTPTAPAAPIGVSASDGAFTDRVRIVWNPAAGATSYHVYRNVINNSGSATDIGTGPGTAADDMSAVVGTTYWYWVRAFNAGGGSPFSVGDTGYRGGAAPTPTPTPTTQPTPTPQPTPTGLSANFIFTPTAPLTGQTVRFTDASNLASSWQWTFGDSYGSTAQNPSHVYATRGTYTVTLRVSNGVSSSQISKTVAVGARARRHLPKR
jgi:PKD repeat protein